MPITEGEWQSITEHVEQIIARVAGRAGDHFFIDRVMRRDANNLLIWVAELGDTPVPLFAFNYDVTYYDESPRDTGLSFGAYKVFTKKAKVRPLCPEIGEVVLVVREMGVNRLPRCLGVLQSLNFELTEET